jgi:hypothetical protein
MDLWDPTNKTVTMTDFATFKRLFGPRIEFARMDLNDSYTMYTEKGQEEFLTELEKQEAFREFCDEYYDYMRERWNACSGSMWESFEDFRDKYESNYTKYWAYLKSC